MQKEIITLKSNGITLGIRKTKSPITDIHIGVKIGSQLEEESERGMAHVVEHILFRGTKDLTGPEYVDQLSLLGGTTNAYTGMHETVYYLTLPSVNHKKGLDLFLEAFSNPPMREKDYLAEIKVVQREFQAEQDSNDSIHYNQILKAALGKNFSKVIGTWKNLKSFTVEDVKKFYDKHYRGRNIFITISGDIDVDYVKSKLYNLKIKKGKQNRFKNAPLLVKKSTYKKDVHQMKIGWIFPAENTVNFDSYLTQEVLTNYLGRGMDSLLFKKVRDEASLCYSISIWNLTHSSVGMSTIMSEIDPKTSKKYEEVVGKILGNPLPMTRIDLQRVKSKIKTSLTIRSETSFGYNNVWLAGLIDDEDNLLENYLNNIDKICLEDVYEMYEKNYRGPYLMNEYGIARMISK